MEVREVVSVFLMGVGCFFILVASVGLLRLPDFFTRIHPAGKADTLGQALVLMGLIVHNGVDFVSVKLLLIITFIFISNPTATHLLAKAAFVAGVKPWRRSSQDQAAPQEPVA
jgi:multicomponent Na+:H+ antiporter subunit G